MTESLNTLRRVSTKLRQYLEQKPSDSIHVRVTLQRPYNGEKVLQVWDGVQSQAVLGKTDAGVVVLVSRADVERKSRQVHDRMVELSKK